MATTKTAFCDLLAALNTLAVENGMVFRKMVNRTNRKVFAIGFAHPVDMGIPVIWDARSGVLTGGRHPLAAKAAEVIRAHGWQVN